MNMKLIFTLACGLCIWGHRTQAKPDHSNLAKFVTEMESDFKSDVPMLVKQYKDKISSATFNDALVAYSVASHYIIAVFEKILCLQTDYKDVAKKARKKFTADMIPLVLSKTKHMKGVQLSSLKEKLNAAASELHYMIENYGPTTVLSMMSCVVNARAWPWSDAQKEQFFKNLGTHVFNIYNNCFPGRKAGADIVLREILA